MFFFWFFLVCLESYSFRVSRLLLFYLLVVIDKRTDKQTNETHIYIYIYTFKWTYTRIIIIVITIHTQQYSLQTETQHTYLYNVPESKLFLKTSKNRLTRFRQLLIYYVYLTLQRQREPAIICLAASTSGHTHTH